MTPAAGYRNDRSEQRAAHLLPGRDMNLSVRAAAPVLRGTQVSR